jgi:SHR-binding domain of vacuolar-sorting associated protein 13
LSFKYILKEDRKTKPNSVSEWRFDSVKERYLILFLFHLHSYLSINLFISLYLSLSLFISHYLSLSLAISLFLFISLYFSLPLFTSLYLALSLHPLANTFISQFQRTRMVTFSPHYILVNLMSVPLAYRQTRAKINEIKEPPLSDAARMWKEENKRG